MGRRGRENIQSSRGGAYLLKRLRVTVLWAGGYANFESVFDKVNETNVSEILYTDRCIVQSYFVEEVFSDSREPTAVCSLLSEQLEQVRTVLLPRRGNYHQHG